mgnify:CR=1 FL=1
MIVWCVIRFIIEIAIAFIAVKSFVFGADIMCAITSTNYWAVQLVGGCAALSVVYYVMSKAKDILFYIFKGSAIWMLTHPREKNPLIAMGAIVKNWKETISIPAINVMVRTSLKEIIQHTDFDGIPKSIKSLCNSKIGQLTSLMIKSTVDYADECVLAWCYSHGDRLLKECVDGIVVFCKHCATMIMAIVPVRVLIYILRFLILCWCTYSYIFTVGITFLNIVPAILCISFMDKVIYRTFFEPMLMAYTVKVYSKYLNDDPSALSEYASKIASMTDLTSLKHIIGGNESDENATDQCGDSENNSVTNAETMDSGNE